MDMAYRLETPDRLGRAGIKKIGLGPLFGLSAWRADAWFTGLHLRHLERTYWRTRYSISFRDCARMKVEKSGLRRSASAIWRRHSVRFGSSAGKSSCRSRPARARRSGTALSNWGSPR